MFNLSMNRVHDTVKINEGAESLILKVDADPMRMVAGLSKTQEMMKALNADSTDEELESAALYYASVIFGKEQAEKLADFYHRDAGCVIGICGKYFTGRLSALIVKAQKKNKK